MQLKNSLAQINEPVAVGIYLPDLSRTGTVSRLLLFVLVSIVVVVVLGMAALNLHSRANHGKASIEFVKIYCAASVVKPIEQLVEKYNQTFDGNIEIVRTGGSGELAGQIKTEFKTEMKLGADLFVSADEDLLAKGQVEGVISQRFRLAEQRPVISVRADYRGDLDSLQELAYSEKLKFGLASEQAAVGIIVREIARRESLLNPLERRNTVDAENVMTLAQGVVAGSLDAAVIWDTTVIQVNQINEGPVLKVAAFADETNRFKSSIAIGVLSSTSQSPGALKFCRYLSCSDESKDVFQQFGFSN